MENINREDCLLLERLKNYNIYLASQSPRRLELLKEMNINFNIASAVYVEESYNKNLRAEEIALFLSEKKSDAYSFILKDNRLLITADTIVSIDNEVLGKPSDREDAIEMLKKLSCKKHSVITAITISTKDKKNSFFCNTEVWFKKLNIYEINYYIDNFKPFDKAGAYGIQEWIGAIGIQKIRGSYSNVVGLPTEKLYVELDKFID